MNAMTLVKQYDKLSPEERFRLILAASGRGDEAERTRLAESGERVHYSQPDHAPYAEAFEQLAWLVFIELLEDAAKYMDAFQHADDVAELEEDNSTADWTLDEREDQPASGSEAGDAAHPTRNEEPRLAWQRCLDIALALGFMFRTKMLGWTLFCERLGVPPFLMVEGFPGFDRLQRTFKLTESAAYKPEGFRAWLNRVRPAGQPEVVDVGMTPERHANGMEEAFQKAVQLSGG